MAKKDLRIDAYIAKSADFAKPILNHFRELVHKACPEVIETLKWGFPYFDYKKGPMCYMAAFKAHCAVGFWKAKLMHNNSELVKNAMAEEAMGHLGRLTSVKDFPKNSTIIKHIKEAMRLNDEGIKLSNKRSGIVKKELIVPDYFTDALSKNETAQFFFEAFSPSRKREYIEWITEAKTETTRYKRISKAIEQLSAEKNLHWKYDR